MEKGRLKSGLGAGQNRRASLLNIGLDTPETLPPNANP
jgi:hypothetical protein